MVFNIAAISFESVKIHIFFTKHKFFNLLVHFLRNLKRILYLCNSLFVVMYSENKTTRRRLAGSYLISLMSIMLVLLVLGMFASLLFYANELSDYIRENIGFEIVIKKVSRNPKYLNFNKNSINMIL